MKYYAWVYICFVLFKLFAVLFQENNTPLLWSRLDSESTLVEGLEHNSVPRHHWKFKAFLSYGFCNKILAFQNKNCREIYFTFYPVFENKLQRSWPFLKVWEGLGKDTYTTHSVKRWCNSKSKNYYQKMTM